MAPKSILGEIVEDIYPVNKTGALFDIILFALLAYVVYKSLLQGETTYKAEYWGMIYLVWALAAGVKYAYRRNILAQGGCLGMLIRIALIVPIGFIYAPFMLVFAVRRLRGKPEPKL